jgi:imidazolonepropionase-like amidohydrolase
MGPRKALAALILAPALAFAQPLAITGVTLIDGTNALPQPGMTVLVDGERIAALGQTAAMTLPADAQIVDGTGKFLIPGLWDMHVHWEDADFLPLFTANGVTGVRMMWGQPHHLEWRKNGVGPRLALAGTIVDGPRPYWKGSIAVTTAEDARAAVQKTRADGFDFVKIYNGIPRAAFFALAAEARKEGIPFAGHLPGAIRAAEASAAGMKSMEHLQGLLLAVSGDEEGVRREQAALFKRPRTPERDAAIRATAIRAIETYDAARAAALWQALKANGTWQVPTLTVLRYEAFANDPAHAADPRLRYVSAYVRNMWASAQAGRIKDVPPEAFAFQARFFKRRLALVGEMHRAGVGILAGSDVLNPYCYPGFGLHDELALLVEAGLSPMAALQAATRDAAAFLQRNDFGTVEAGKLADLVLLDADPLQDIRNTRRIAAVVAGGKLHARAALERMLADAEARARH